MCRLLFYDFEPFLDFSPLSPAYFFLPLGILVSYMNTHSFVVAIIAGIAPSLIWIWFWTREDAKHDEPKWLLVTAFLSGIVAVALAVVFEKIIAGVPMDPSLLYTAWAATEEILKFGVLAIIISSTYDSEPIKPMVYGIVIALGFSAFENTLFIMGPLSQGLIAKSIVTGNMRFIGATLVHVVSTALIGFSYGFTYYRGKVAKACSLLLGLVGAVALHAAFNLSIIDASSSNTLKTFFWVWGAVVVLIILFEEVKAVRPKVTRPDVRFKY